MDDANARGFPVFIAHFSRSIRGTIVDNQGFQLAVCLAENAVQRFTLERIKEKRSLIRGRARPPGGPCPWMVCDGPPEGRPLPKTATLFLKML